MNGYAALKALSHPELLMSCTTESFTQSVGTWASSLFGEQARHAHLRLLHQLFPLLRKMCSYSGSRLTSPVHLSSGLYQASPVSNPTLNVVQSYISLDLDALHEKLYGFRYATYIKAIFFMVYLFLYSKNYKKINV